MDKQYNRKEIFNYLMRHTVGVLSTFNRKSEEIRLRVMYYGIDNKFNFYLISTKGSPKVEQIVSSFKISFLVYKIEEPYDNSWEVEVNGRAEISQKESDIKSALEKLKNRNPFADVAIESNITGQFDLIKLKPSVLRFRIYRDALEGINPTVLEL